MDAFSYHDYSHVDPYYEPRNRNTKEALFNPCYYCKRESVVLNARTGLCFCKHCNHNNSTIPSLAEEERLNQGYAK